MKEDRLRILYKIPGMRKPKDERHEPVSVIVRDDGERER